MRETYRIRVARELFKFSCAHMTVFPGGRKERLHGHNYAMEIALDLRDASFGSMVDFGALKAAGRALAERLRERLLLAAENPYLEVDRDAWRDAWRDDGPDHPPEIEFRLAGKRYVLPREDVLLLPIDNVSTEALAGYAARSLAEELEPVLPAGAVAGIEVTVEESPGQGASCYRALG